MMLNRVDLPHPEGPLTPRNSPGATPSDTSSTAVTTPSGVSNRLVMWSTTRMFPAGEAADNRSDGWISAAMASRVSLASLRLLLGFGPYSTSPLPHAPQRGGRKCRSDQQQADRVRRRSLCNSWWGHALGLLPLP